MKKIYYIFCIFIWFSCSDKNNISQNDLVDNFDINDIVMEINEIEPFSKNENENFTINDKLDLNIPGIGERMYRHIFSFEKIEIYEDRYGYEELIDRLKNSFLMIPISPSPSWEEATIFDNNGIIKIEEQFSGIVPHYGDGDGFQIFVVIGKFEKEYDDTYYKSKNYTDEIIITFDNFISSENAERRNVIPHMYKLHVFYKLIE